MVLGYCSSCRNGEFAPHFLRRPQRDQPGLDFLGSISDRYFPGGVSASDVNLMLGTFGLWQETQALGTAMTNACHGSLPSRTHDISMGLWGLSRESVCTNNLASGSLMHSC